MEKYAQCFFSQTNKEKNINNVRSLYFRRRRLPILPACLSRWKKFVASNQIEGNMSLFVKELTKIQFI